MAITLSPNLATATLEQILMHHRGRVKSLKDHLSDAQRRSMVTSSEKFVFPFEHSVILGLYSGENKNGCLVRLIKIMSCYKAIKDFYPADSIVRISAVREAIKDVFNVSYGLGTEFHDIPSLRDKDRKIQSISLEQGCVFIYAMVDGLSINVEDKERFAKSVWWQYASGISPALFNS